MFAVSVYILEDKPLVSAFPGEYARAADEYNSRYEFARTGEFARENGLDDLYGHEDADYAPAVAEALAEQEISTVLDGYQRMYRLLIEGDLTGAQNEADTLAYDLTRLCQPQDYMPGAARERCAARGMELARTILLNEGDDGTLYAALTGDDISAVYEAEDAVRAMLSASIYEQDAAQSEAAPAQGEAAEAAGRAGGRRRERERARTARERRARCGQRRHGAGDAGHDERNAGRGRRGMIELILIIIVVWGRAGGAEKGRQNAGCGHVGAPGAQHGPARAHLCFRGAGAGAPRALRHGDGRCGLCAGGRGAGVPGLCRVPQRRARRSGRWTPTRPKTRRNIWKTDGFCPAIRRSITTRTCRIR